MRSLTYGDDSGMWASCDSWDLVHVDFAFSLHERANDMCRYGDLISLLTREENKHIINTKDRCGPGAVWASSSHFVSLDDP